MKKKMKELNKRLAQQSEQIDRLKQNMDKP